MKKAILLTGFNNWGKTWHLRNLFFNGKRHNFMSANVYQIPKVNADFQVQPASNDDLNEQKYIAEIYKRAKKQNLFAAFCPTREPNNNSYRILTSLPLSGYEVYFFLLKYKWDHHAELRIPDIRKHLRGIKKVHFVTIDADAKIAGDAQRAQARETQIITQLQRIFS